MFPGISSRLEDVGREGSLGRGASGRDEDVRLGRSGVYDPRLPRAAVVRSPVRSLRSRKRGALVARWTRVHTLPDVTARGEVF